MDFQFLEASPLERIQMSNYFVFMQDQSLVGEYAHFNDEPDNYDFVVWTNGVPIPRGPAFKLRTSEEYSPTLSDVLLTRINLFVFSDTFRTLLEGIGVRNIEYHPVEVEFHDSGDVLETYAAANILGQISCLDESTGDIRRSRQTGDIIGLEEFTLEESKVIPTSEMQSEALLFRLKEFPSLVLVHQRVKDAVEASEVTGFKFVEPEKYMGI